MDISLTSYVCDIISRLVYFENDKFQQKYESIFSAKNKILYDQLKFINQASLSSIFNKPIQYLSSCNIEVNNIINSSNTLLTNSSNYQFISISTSNYSSVYIIADQTMNTIFVAFRGTYSFKSALSYSKLSTVKPHKICESSNAGLLLGIFKIVNEIYHTIIQSIHFLSSSFLKNKKSKIITTGHSLGGACSTLFSYLFNINQKQKIICITFGSPRVFNAQMVYKFNQLVIERKIMFRRYITNGDPFTKLPPNFKYISQSLTFFHPDDLNKKLNYTAISCVNDDVNDINNNKKTNNSNKNNSKKNRTMKNNKLLKIKCNLKSKTQKIRSNLKYHGNYLGISYKGAAQNLTNIKKEIKRNKDGDTICRIIIGGDNKKTRVGFFNLQEAKYLNYKNIDKKQKKREKIKKLFMTEYKHGDILMTKLQFSHILKNISLIKASQKNPLSTTNYIQLLNIEPEEKIKICE
jgi:hypothetical protein